MESSKRKIILYPGSFNPIHIGHMALACYTVNTLKADELWFLVSPKNPLKSGNDILPLEKRKELISYTIKEDKRFKLCNIENLLPAPYYTSRTLRALEALYDYNFYLLVGGDSFASMDIWYNGIFLKKNNNIVVYPREGSTIESDYNKKNIQVLDNAPKIEISSTHIREAKKRGDNFMYYMPCPELWDMF